MLVESDFGCLFLLLDSNSLSHEHSKTCNFDSFLSHFYQLIEEINNILKVFEYFNCDQLLK
jgi:hypothetical protein